jgi:hypothetical protein
MSSENPDFQLWDHIVSVHEIECQVCSFKETIQAFDAEEACAYFYEEGWRVPRSKCYCPKCSKKK